MSIESFFQEHILAGDDELNGRPRKKRDYHTPEKQFEKFLDSVYTVSDQRKHYLGSKTKVFHLD